MQNLKDKILAEMVADHENALERIFDKAKSLLQITKTGKIFLPKKDVLTGEEQVLIYLIGKLYAKECGLSAEETVNNRELMEELGIPEGSLYPWIKNLRENNKIKSIGHKHTVPLNQIERILNEILEKVGKKRGVKNGE